MVKDGTKKGTRSSPRAMLIAKTEKIIAKNRHQDIKKLTKQTMALNEAQKLVVKLKERIVATGLSVVAPKDHDIEVSSDLKEIRKIVEELLNPSNIADFASFMINN